MNKLIYLVSSLGFQKKENGKKTAKKIDESNGLLENLSTDLADSSTLVFIPGSSYDFDRNDSIFRNLKESFALSQINIQNFILIDDRFNGDVYNTILHADVIFIGGGYPLEQMEFMNKIGLKKILEEFSGIVIAQSAGAMNAAENVLCSPEGVDCLDDPIEWKGLGLTELNIEPHFELNIDQNDENSMLVRQALLNLSYIKPFLAIPNGSYVRSIDNTETLYGESYKISKGRIEQINEKDNRKVISKKHIV